MIKKDKKTNKRSIRLLAIFMATILFLGNNTSLQNVVFAEESPLQEETEDTIKVEETSESKESDIPKESSEAEETVQSEKNDETEETSETEETVESEKNDETEETSETEETVESEKNDETEESSETEEAVESEKNGETEETSETEETGESEKNDETEETSETEETGESEEISETEATDENNTDINEQIPEEVTAFLKAVGAIEIPEELTEENAEEFIKQYKVVSEAFENMENSVEDYENYPGVKEAIDKMNEAEELISKFEEFEEQIPEEVTAFLKAVEAMEIPEELTKENAEEFIKQYKVVSEAFENMENSVEDYENYPGVKEAIDKMHEAEELISKFEEFEEQIPKEVTAFLKAIEAMEIPKELTKENAEEFIKQYQAVCEAFENMKNSVENYENYPGVKEAIDKMNEAEELISKFTEGIEFLADTNFVDIDSFEKFQEFITYVNKADSGTFTANITADFEITSEIELDKNTVQIIGNGHTISMSDNYFGVNSSGKLILGSEDESDTLTIDGNLSIYGTMDMYSGVFLANSSTSTVMIYDPGLFNMHGGTIKNNSDSRGSCVAINGGTFNMYGGKIYDFKSQYGHGVSVIGTFNMYGGSIENCINLQGEGGGVYVSKGTFNMYAGKIYKCQAPSGGGVYVINNGLFNMSGTASIDDNTATSYGGGVYINNSTFNMSGGIIKKCSTYVNKTTCYGGGVFVTNNATFNMSGNASITAGISRQGGGVCISSGTVNMNENASITGNSSQEYQSTTIDGGGGVYVSSNGYLYMNDDSSITSNRADNYGGGVICYGTFSMKNNAKVTNNRAHIASGVYVSGSLEMLGNTQIAYNTSRKNAGGVYVNRGKFNMYENTSITNNTAENYAGGVLVYEPTEISLTKVYNNEATVQGDDYYGTITNLTLPPISINKKGEYCPSTCTSHISGWYLDQTDSRWGTYNGNSHSCNKNAYYVEYNPKIHNTTQYIALKAAHAFVPVETSYKVIWKDTEGNEIQSEERKGYVSYDVKVKEADKELEGYKFDTENVGNVLEAEVKENGETELILYFKDDIYYNIEIKYDSLEFSYEAKEIKWDVEALEYKVIAEPTGNTQKEIIVTNKSNRDVELLPSLNKEGSKTGVTYTMSLKQDNETLATITDTSDFKETTSKKRLTCNDDGSNKATLTLKVEKVGFMPEVEGFTDFKVATLSLEFTAVE